MRPPTVSGGRPEKELVERAAAFLEKRGYRAYINPDSTDYFDLVARRGPEVGLVEAKMGNARALLAQALRRRAWGDWVAVVLPSRRSAERLIRETTGRSAAPVGVWLEERGEVYELRGARPIGTGSPGSDPFGPQRTLLHRVLDQIDRGEIPLGVRWSGLLGEVRRASVGRQFAEWRLDERP
jgi:hypothetical protein